MAKYKYTDFEDLQVGQFFKVKGCPHIFQVDKDFSAQQITGKNAGEVSDFECEDQVRVIQIKIIEVK